MTINPESLVPGPAEVAALQHLGQLTPPELDDGAPAEVLAWATRHWDSTRIEPRRAATAETFGA